MSPAAETTQTTGIRHLAFSFTAIDAMGLKSRQQEVTIFDQKIYRLANI